jgi:hypothetical protein
MTCINQWGFISLRGYNEIIRNKGIRTPGA